jgi:hypothetical protein
MKKESHEEESHRHQEARRHALTSVGTEVKRARDFIMRLKIMHDTRMFIHRFGSMESKLNLPFYCLHPHCKSLNYIVHVSCVDESSSGHPSRRSVWKSPFGPLHAQVHGLGCKFMTCRLHDRCVDGAGQRSEP